MKGNDNDEETSSHQNKIWKQIQARTKPILSPNLGARDDDQKKERGMWMFKRKKKKDNILDRVMSSSQPDLFLSAPLICNGQESPLCGTADPSSSHCDSDEEKMDGASKRPIGGMSSPKHTVSYLVQSHHKSSSLGSACLEKLSAERVHNSTEGDDRSGGDAETEKIRDVQPGSGVLGAAGVNPTRALPSSGLYKLELHLKKGHNLAIRDRGGTSDPYVKLKLCGKEVFRSQTIHKNLNPVWDEKTTLLLENLQEPLYVKVFDYDFGRQDDFMGSAYLYLESLEQQRTLPVTLRLEDPHHPEQNLGTLELAVTLTPKDSPTEEHTDPAQKVVKSHRWRPYVNKQHQSLRLFDIHRKAQLWRGIVSISLIEGRDLLPMDPNGLSDPYTKFRLGPQKYKSKTMPKTLCPQWREQFDLHMYEETGGVLEVTVWDKDTGRRDDFMGRCQLDLSTLAKEHTHRLELPLEESRGLVVLLVTLTASSYVSISDLSITSLDDANERKHILQCYGFLRSFSNVKDVGIVQVKVLRAEGLMAADVTGKSDPFCVLELNNDRLQTHTVYKSLNPEWNKMFTLNVKDIHSVLEVTVFDEDRDRSADFLGKIAIPLLHIQNGERKGYVLKNKELTVPTKGVIFLESEVIYNTVKAGLRTMVPLEQKYIEEEPKVSKHLLQRNFNRVKRCIMVLINIGTYINSCFEWEYPQRSILSFLLFVVVVWNFEIYMVPLALLLLLAWNYIATSGREAGDRAMEDMFEWEEEEDEKDDKDSERKGFMDKLYAIQDVCISVQNALDEVASYAERIRNTFNWTVPFLSKLAIAALCVAALLLFLIPLRYLVLLWGVNKFTKKLRDPYLIDNNELLDFLSRVPSDVQVMQYRELKVDPGQSPNKRKRTNPG